MSTTKRTEIFFHVGLGKTGTTYLQYSVFPKMKNIYYIQRTRYNKAKEIIAGHTYNTYFISREFDQQFEKEIRDFSATYPHTKTIIVFRQHNSWIASQYRRFVKNGYTKPFNQFLDLENDTGFFSKQDLSYFHKLELIEKYFTEKPLVLFYEEMRQKPHEFFRKISDFTGATLNPDDISLSSRHTSYELKQLKAILKVGKVVNIRKRRIFDNNVLHFFWRLGLNSIRYSTLYAARLMPNSWFEEGPLIEKKELDAVAEYFRNDWQKCLDYAKKNNPV